MALVKTTVILRLEARMYLELLRFAPIDGDGDICVDEAVADCVRSWLTLGEGAKISNAPQNYPENGSSSTVVSDSEIPFGNAQS